MATIICGILGGFIGGIVIGALGGWLLKPQPENNIMDDLFSLTNNRLPGEVDEGAEFMARLALQEPVTPNVFLWMRMTDGWSTDDWIRWFNAIWMNYGVETARARFTSALNKIIETNQKLPRGFNRPDFQNWMAEVGISKEARDRATNKANATSLLETALTAGVAIGGLAAAAYAINALTKAGILGKAKK